MSIVRIGLGETKDFGDGYEAIFGKKEKKAEQPKPEASADAKKVPAAGEAKTATSSQ